MANWAKKHLLKWGSLIFSRGRTTVHLHMSLTSFPVAVASVSSAFLFVQ